MRHGQAGDPASKRYIGRTDTGLTSLGRCQAAALAELLSVAPLRRVVSSDLGRCLHTARAVAARHGLIVEADPGLGEIDLGEWENRTFEDVRRTEPEAFRRRGEDMAGFRPPGGESFADLRNRVVPRLEAIMADASGCVAVVAHAGVNRVALCRWLGMPLADLFLLGQDPGCLNVLDFSPSGFKRLQALNFSPGG